MLERHSGTVTEGTVEQVNGTGIRIAGEWLNVSKFRPVALPAVGALVRVETDGKGFITRIDQDADRADEQIRDETTVRLAVLQAAATYLGQVARAREDVKADHVLLLADKWLEWVER